MIGRDYPLYIPIMTRQAQRDRKHNVNPVSGCMLVSSCPTHAIKGWPETGLFCSAALRCSETARDHMIRLLRGHNTHRRLGRTRTMRAVRKAEDETKVGHRALNDSIRSEVHPQLTHCTCPTRKWISSRLPIVYLAEASRILKFIVLRVCRRKSASWGKVVWPTNHEHLKRRP